MKYVERWIWAGPTLEVQTYTSETGRCSGEPDACPSERFETEEDRQSWMLNRARRHFVRLVNENFTPEGYYCTLTCNKENTCHTYAAICYLWMLFWRRIKREYPDARMVGVAGRNGSEKDENGKKKRNGDSYHIHMLIEGVPEDVIRRQWKYGENIRVEHLWEHVMYEDGDHGADYTKLAEYMLDHWTPEQGKRKWKSTKNLRQPEVEVKSMPATDEMKRLFGTGIRDDRPMPDVPQGYRLVREEWTKYGFQSLLFIKEPEKPKKRRNGQGKTDREEKKKKGRRSILDKVKDRAKQMATAAGEAARQIAGEIKGRETKKKREKKEQ